MCCWYKGVIPDRKCSAPDNPKKKEKLTVYSNKDKRHIRISPDAEWIHHTVIKEADCNVSAYTSKANMFHRAMCTDCRDSTGKNMINLKYLYRQCCFCKECFTSDKDVLVVCTECSKHINDFENWFSED